MATDISKYENLDSKRIRELLSLTDSDEIESLYQAAYKVKVDTVGKKLNIRGLVEFSNICQKDCNYCGLRCSNKSVNRYELSVEEIMKAAEVAHTHRLGSLVLQSGERSDKKFIDYVAEILSTIKNKYGDEFHVTLSSGEQDYQTYVKWHEAGADRYLLRFETSNRDLYSRIHPANKMHSYDRRMECLQFLRDAGYQVGSGMLIAVPYQTVDLLAEDLLFLKKLDIDMVGMGPYLEHEHAPLAKLNHLIPPIFQRMEITLRSISILRLLMPDINIASVTALETISQGAKIKGLQVGANVMMPNITPSHREDYFLYENKPVNYNDFAEELAKLNEKVESIGETINFGDWGDTLHYNRRAGKS